VARGRYVLLETALHMSDDDISNTFCFFSSSGGNRYASGWRGVGVAFGRYVLLETALHMSDDDISSSFFSFFLGTLTQIDR